MTLTYNVTRKQASDYLGVSTRTIDRYVKKWQLSYKKVANKVILAQSEIDKLKEEFDLLQQQPVAPTVERKATTGNVVEESTTLSSNNTSSISGIGEFASILDKKDKTIEEKNQLIYMLQRKIGEVETQMIQMVALPHHTEEKEKMQTAITDLESEKVVLQNQIRRERMRNAIYVALIIIAALVLVFWIY